MSPEQSRKGSAETQADNSDGGLLDGLESLLEEEGMGLVKHVEALKSYRGVVKPVKRGDLISEIVTTETEPGEDIYGNRIEIEEEEELYLDMGDHTELSEDGSNCLSSIYGYASTPFQISKAISTIAQAISTSMAYRASI